VPERRVPAVALVEVVAVEQDRHQQQDPVQEAVAGRRGQRGGRAAPGRQVPRPAGQAAQHARQFGAQMARRDQARLVVRPQQVPRDAHGHQPGAAIAESADQQRAGRADLAAARDQVHADSGDSADKGHDCPRGGRDRVRHDELVRADDVRQRRGQRRQEEPVNPQHQQGADIERQTQRPQRDERRGQHDEAEPQQRRPDQDLPPRPAVDEHPGERPHQGVGQVQDGKSHGGGRRVGEARRVEEHVGAEAGVEDPVARLGDQPGSEQPAEVTLAQNGLQFSGECRPGPPAAQAPLAGSPARGAIGLRRHAISLRPATSLAPGRR
jgi:hypothetical protein